MSDQPIQSQPDNLSVTVPLPVGTVTVPLPVGTVTVPASAITDQPPAEQPLAEPSLSVLPDGQNIHVFAKYPYQMQAAQRGLVEWCDRKIQALVAEADDLFENLEIAKKNGWGTAAFYRHHALARKRVEYYEKMKAALLAGHCIVPNFPVDVIAVRVTRQAPRKNATTSRASASTPVTDSPPAGEGRYVTGQAVDHWTEKGKYYDGREYDQHCYMPVAFDESMEFPFTTARPAVLSATARAMLDKVFDEIGVLPGRTKKEDPIIVGRIVDPRSTKYNRRFVTFLIAWFIDTRDL